MNTNKYNIDNILELEKKAKSMLFSIQSIKNNPYSNDDEYQYTLSSFYENLAGLRNFISSMRTRGFLGRSPQREEDLDMQQLFLEMLGKLKIFVEGMNEKYK